MRRGQLLRLRRHQRACRDRAPGVQRPPRCSTTPEPARYLMLSAATESALRAMAQNYAARIDALSPGELPPLASARPLSSRATGDPTRCFNHRSRDAAQGSERLRRPEAITLRSPMAPPSGDNLPVAFVYSGNGSQWAGMGIAAYRRNASVSCAIRFGRRQLFQTRRLVVAGDALSAIGCARRSSGPPLRSP